MALLFGNNFGDLIAILAIVISLGYFYIQHSFAYWKRCGIPYITPYFPCGTPNTSTQRNRSIQISEIYKSSTERIVGIFSFTKPLLLLRDPEIIRAVLIKDFHYFHDRGMFMDEKTSPLTGHLFNMSGDKWRTLRAQLTPTFTSGKLKSMFSTIIECGETLTAFMDKAVAANAIVDMRELLSQLTTNIVASVAFGLKVDAITDPQTPFRIIGRKMFDESSSKRQAMSIAFPRIFKFLRIKVTSPDVENFMLSVVKQNMEYREHNNVSRNDFFQLLLQLRNTGKVQLDGEWKTEIVKDEKDKKFSMNQCAAQSSVFFSAGFETSSATMSFCLYELARNADLQEKVHLEIDQILKQYNGEATYEAVQQMKLLENCIDETLRLWPPAPALVRQCNKDWTIPGTSTVIKSGVMVVVPIYGIHRDAQHFEEPEQFKPDRFADKSYMIDKPYLPFGDGPRACIGLRLAKVQVKVGLLLLLRSYSFELAGNTKVPLVMGGSRLLSPIGGVQLQASHRKTFNS